MHADIYFGSFHSVILQNLGLGSIALARSEADLITGIDVIYHIFCHFTSLYFTGLVRETPLAAVGMISIVQYRVNQLVTEPPDA